MLATRTAAAAALPSIAPFLAYLRLEVRRSLRNRRYLVFTVVFPVMLYVLYTAILPATANGPVGGLPWDVYFLVSMAAYGAIGAAMSQAAPIATERRAGWARQLRVTPLPGIAYVAAKVASAILITVPALALVGAAGQLVNHVDLGIGTWAGVIVVLALGSIPFAALGLVIGYVLDAESAQGGMVLSYFTLAILGGLFAPLEAFPPGIATIGSHAPVVPLRQPRAVRRRGPAARPCRRRCPGRLGRAASGRSPPGATSPTSGPAGPERRDGSRDRPETTRRPGAGDRRAARRAAAPGSVRRSSRRACSSRSSRSSRCVTDPPVPGAFVLLLAGWAIFVGVVVVMFRGGPFARPFGSPRMVAAVVAMVALAVVAQVAFGTSQGSALYFYAGVTAARLGRRAAGARRHRARGRRGAPRDRCGSWRLEHGGRHLGHGGDDLAHAVRAGPPRARQPGARGRAQELAELAVAEERSPDRPRPPRHARPQPVADRAQERARPARPGRRPGSGGVRDRRRRAGRAREALASVRETVSGYRQPSLAIELAGRPIGAGGGRDRRRGRARARWPAARTSTRSSAGPCARASPTSCATARRASARIRVDRRRRRVRGRGRRRRASGASRAGRPTRGTALAGLRERASRPRRAASRRGRCPTAGSVSGSACRCRTGPRPPRDPRAPRRGPGDGPGRARRAARARGATSTSSPRSAAATRSWRGRSRRGPDVALLDIEMPGLDGLRRGRAAPGGRARRAAS